MTEDKDIKHIIENLMTETAPNNFEVALMDKIEALQHKPIPKFKPIIANKIWYFISLVFLLALLLIKFTAYFESLSIDLFQNVLPSLSKLPNELIIIPIIPLALYFVDVVRKYRFEASLKKGIV